MKTAQELEAEARQNHGVVRVSNTVVGYIRQMLAEGKFVPGDRLPAERNLAEDLGVGRNSIREALREMEMMGLVEARRGSGTFVRKVDPTALMAPFRSVISLSGAVVDDVIEFRLAFEPEMAALAATNADDKGIADLQRALRRFDDALESDGEPHTADLDFHEVVAQCTGNPLMIAVHHALAQLFAELRTRLSDNTYQPDNRVARGHQALFGAIVAGDPDAARDVMRQHIVEAHDSLLQWWNDDKARA